MAGRPGAATLDRCLACEQTPLMRSPTKTEGMRYKGRDRQSTGGWGGREVRKERERKKREIERE